MRPRWRATPRDVTFALGSSGFLQPSVRQLSRNQSLRAYLIGCGGLYFECLAWGRLSQLMSQSDADQAYLRLKELLEKKALFRYSDPKLSEADTRAKLIDPLFRDVLGWTEAEIRREKPANSGFADYVLGLDAAFLLIEAKRTNPRFHLDAPSHPRKLRLDGPHLLGQKKVKPLIEQVQSYASSLGAQFAILTNGSQLVIFKPYLPGRSWTTGTALVFHDHDDIVQDFALFHRLLSREPVCAGSLLEEFEHIEGITTTLYTPIQFLDDADNELVRNPFWIKISRVLSPLFTDNLEDPALQAEIIQNCYVTTPLSDQADASLDRRIRDTLPPSLKDAGIREVAPGLGRYSAFGHGLEQDIVGSRPGSYVLTGGVGSGKTTFLRRFAMIDRGFVKNYCIWVHIDFLPIGNVEENKIDSEIRRFVYQAIRQELIRAYPSKIPNSGSDIRQIILKRTRTSGTHQTLFDSQGIVRMDERSERDHRQSLYGRFRLRRCAAKEVHCKRVATGLRLRQHGSIRRAVSGKSFSPSAEAVPRAPSTLDSGATRREILCSI